MESTDNAQYEVQCPDRCSAPNDAPVVYVIRITKNKIKCFKSPNVTWGHPCYYKKDMPIPCDEFKDVIEKFLQDYKDMLVLEENLGAILFAVNCKGIGLKWYAILDDPTEGYCYDIAVENLSDGCVIL